MKNQIEKPIFTKNREELSKKYFGDMSMFYGSSGNMAIISLLSDVQEMLAMREGGVRGEHYRQLLNDIKCVLKNDPEVRERDPEVTVRYIRGEFFVNYWKDNDNFGMNEGTLDLEKILNQVTEGVNILREDK